MTGLLRLLLGCVGATLLLGGIWFLGSAGSYAGLLGGITMFGWALFWNGTGKIQLLNAVFAVLSIASTSWVAITRMTSDPGAAPFALLVVLIAIASAAAWLRQRTWL